MKLIPSFTITYLMIALCACNQQPKQVSDKNAGEKMHMTNNHVETENAQVVAEFKNADLNTAYKHYLEMTASLVNSNSEKAKEQARKLNWTLLKIKNAEKAANLSKEIAKTNDLTKQRSAFVDLSNEMIELTKNSELNTGEAYVAFCPMANDSKGAYWLASEKEIMNPYFGDKMLHCGSVKETIK